MSIHYQETLEGESHLRIAPGARHELICKHLHKHVGASVARVSSTKLLAARTSLAITKSSTVCPDLALITTATGKLWLAAEIVNSEDHRADTVIKKQLYEEIRLPRLWMIDPRYDNVEVYHCGEYGLVLKNILAGREILSEKLLPDFQMTIAELFLPKPL